LDHQIKFDQTTFMAGPPICKNDTPVWPPAAELL